MAMQKRAERAKPKTTQGDAWQREDGFTAETQGFRELCTGDTLPRIEFAIGSGEVSRTVILSDGRRQKMTLKAPSVVGRAMDADAMHDLAWLKSKTMPRQRNLKDELRIVDLFCGCGGLTLGVREKTSKNFIEIPCAESWDMVP